MVMVDVDDTLYEKVKKIVKKNSIEYPTIKNFIDKSINRGIIKINKKEVS